MAILHVHVTAVAVEMRQSIHVFARAEARVVCAGDTNVVRKLREAARAALEAGRQNRIAPLVTRRTHALILGAAPQ